MRKVRYIGTYPQEGFGTLLRPGDVVEVDDDVALDLLSREGQFAEVGEGKSTDSWRDDEQ